MPDIWYVADDHGQLGPLTLQELKATLATFSNDKDVLVWCNRFPDWKRPKDIPELKTQTSSPPPLPTSGPGRGHRMAFSLRTTAIAVVLGGAALTSLALFAHVQKEAPDKQQRAPILIAGIQEPDEMRVEPLPVHVPTAQVRMLGEALQSDGSNRTAALDRIIAKYPDYPDAYVMRLGALCEGDNRAAILADVNDALKFVDHSHLGVGKSLGSLLSMRAKIEHAIGDDRAAIDDLDNAIQVKPDDAINFANSGGVAPEKTASLCTWTEPDIDALVQRFPNDYRTYMFRGLYNGFFWFLKPTIEKGKAHLIARRRP